MFGLSLGHILIFGVILLIFVGPEQLPEVARTIARVLNELKRATSDFQSQFTNHIDLQKPWEPRAPPANSAAQNPPSYQMPPPTTMVDPHTLPDNPDAVPPPPEPQAGVNVHGYPNGPPQDDEPTVVPEVIDPTAKEPKS